MSWISKVPNVDRLMIIGDVHGCYEPFARMLDILEPTPDVPLIIMGDYIDRGPDSRQVIETLMTLASRLDLYLLMGNHEASLLEFLKDPLSPEAVRFLLNGGGATLQSYCSEPGDFEIPHSHVEFIRNCKYCFMNDRFFFVHAGVPDVDLEDLDFEEHGEELLWIRDDFLYSTYKWSKTIVHGHTPHETVFISEQRINVDTGCVFENKLSAIELPNLRVFEVPNYEPAELTFFRDHPDSRRKAKRFKGQVDVVVGFQGNDYLFRTANYNEFGVLIETLQDRVAPVFKEGEVISGEILIDDQSSFVFQGRVVRMEESESRFQYGVKFHERPTGRIKLRSHQIGKHSKRKKHSKK